MKEVLLTFEYDDDNEKIEIHANKKGLDLLKKQIEKLLLNESDTHLMTPSWGGEELTEEKQGNKTKLINHVKIFRWN